MVPDYKIGGRDGDGVEEKDMDRENVRYGREEDEIMR